MISTTSFWSSTAPAPTQHPRLEGDTTADVAIVGAGITGVTAALLLAQRGQRVVLLEARRVGQGETGFTTAHLTEAIDTRYATLSRDFGREGARLAADASRAAIDRIEHFVLELGIDCDFRRLAGYLYTERESDLEALHAEHHAANAAGLATSMTREVPLPFPTAGAVVFPRQAELHIGMYLAGLVQAFTAAGGRVFEDTRVTSVDDGDPCTVVTESGVVRAAKVIVAANAPLNRVFLQTKLAHYRSYAIAASVGAGPLSGLFWDTDDPYHYLRSARIPGTEASVLVVGGEDHKTGAVDDTAERYERLVRYVAKRFPLLEVGHRWSAQIVETVDGLPFIGRNSLDTRVYVATGFAGNGITFGTTAGILMTDLVLGRENAWSDLFEPTRVKPVASASAFVTNNAEVGLHMVGDWVRGAEARDLSEIAPGDGKLVKVRGQRLAVYRAPEGELHAVTPVCPHLGCLVHFNAAERSWDCPCHGSRFDVSGAVLNGPSTKPLERVDLAKGSAASDEGAPPTKRTGARSSKGTASPRSRPR